MTPDETKQMKGFTQQFVMNRSLSVDGDLKGKEVAQQATDAWDELNKYYTKHTKGLKEINGDEETTPDAEVVQLFPKDDS